MEEESLQLSYLQASVAETTSFQMDLQLEMIIEFTISAKIFIKVISHP